MAVLLDTYLPFDSGPGANAMETQWREMAKHFIGSASGVIRGNGLDFDVFGDSSGMQVKVSTGECYMRGHFGKSSATKTLPIAAAHATLARKDRVILRVDFVDNEIEVDVLTGTAAASPVAPSVTQNTSIWETSLAVVSVAAAAVTITSGNVVDDVVYTTAAAKFVRTTTTSVPLSGGSYADVVLNSTEIPSGDVSVDTATGFVTIGRAGIWSVSAGAGFSASSSGGRRIQITSSGAVTIYARSDCPTMGSAEPTYVSTSTTEKFPAGQVIKVRVWQNGASAVNTIAGEVYLTVTWVGP